MPETQPVAPPVPRPPKKRTRSTYIKRMGIELEGAWRGERGKPPFEDCDIQHDGSVRPVAGCQHYGEIPSKPMTLDDLIEWTRAHYPNGTNHSMGMHVHVSFRQEKFYYLLTDPLFGKHFLKEMERLGREVLALPSDHIFWERLKGTNTYCRKVHAPSNQMAQSGKGGQRYSHINFCKRLHGTMEVRLFPLFATFEEAEKAIRFLHDLIEGWCARHFKGIPPLVVQTVAPIPGGESINHTVYVKKPTFLGEEI